MSSEDVCNYSFERIQQGKEPELGIFEISDDNLLIFK